MLAAPHHDPWRRLGAVGVQPARAFDSPLKQRTVERVLVIARPKLDTSFDDVEAAEVGRMAHGRAPVAAPYRQVKHGGIGPQDCDHGVAVAGPDRLLQRDGRRVGGDALLQRRPVDQAVLAGDDELSVAELENGGGKVAVSDVLELRMPAADAIQCGRFALSPAVQELPRLALGNGEMGPIGQIP